MRELAEDAPVIGEFGIKKRVGIMPPEVVQDPKRAVILAFVDQYARFRIAQQLVAGMIGKSLFHNHARRFPEFESELGSCLVAKACFDPILGAIDPLGCCDPRHESRIGFRFSPEAQERFAQLPPAIGAIRILLDVAFEERQVAAVLVRQVALIPDMRHLQRGLTDSLTVRGAYGKH